MYLNLESNERAHSQGLSVCCFYWAAAVHTFHDAAGISAAATGSDSTVHTRDLHSLEEYTHLDADAVF